VIIDGYVNLPPPAASGAEPSPDMQAVSRFFGVDAGRNQEGTLDDLLAALDSAGVDRAVLSAELPVRRTGMEVPTIPLDLALEAVATTDRLKVMAVVPGVRQLTATSRLLREAAPDDRIVAAVVCGAMLETSLTDRRLYALYSTLAEAGLPLVANVGIFGPPLASKYQHPLLLEEICADFPELVVIACHMGHPWERLVVRLMMKFPNLHLMTSAYLPTYIDEAVVRFMGSSRGLDRVIFASDYPMLDPGRCLAEARKLALSDEALANYLGGNLARVVGWT
jgi:uncharacterized protein